MTAIEARITVNSRNSAESAIKQLDKLYDIQQIQLLPAEKNNRFSAETYKGIGEQNEVCLSV
jgi:acetolactate synthase regulatory subunit